MPQGRGDVQDNQSNDEKGARHVQHLDNLLQTFIRRYENRQLDAQDTSMSVGFL